MPFVLTCLDRPDSLSLRLENRAAHLAHLASVKERVLLAGPLLGDDGATMQGSLLVLDFDTRAEVEAFAARDPYVKAGLFESVEIRRWRQVLPAPAPAF